MAPSSSQAKSDPTCPYTGETVTYVKLGDAWLAKGRSWITRLFTAKGPLAKKIRSRFEGRTGLEDPPVCPFTGEELTLVYLDGAEGWKAIGPFWYTEFFNTKQDLEAFLSTVAGEVQRPKPVITVRELEEPVPDLLKQEAEDRARVIQDATEEIVDRAIAGDISLD